ncbi:hypothetical protein [Apilactobacillus xinyiensis]|uniref:hypothetical protein n=1 Tax=Apilactobacillus xinyiensis TaxID=2841032 RepID=UPI00200F5CEC|nr:hypothetical protein [Apilactobacillus xinyiensis]MCL0330588.1 hypothetical protein [Apilactobacillus xinyiensis]
MSKSDKVLIISDEIVNQAIKKANDKLSKYVNTAGEQVEFFKSPVSNTVYLADAKWAKTKDYKYVFIGIQHDGMIFFSKKPVIDYRILKIVYELAAAIKD